MPTVTFMPSNKQKSIRAGATILAAANQSEMPMGQSCSGDGICGWCKVKVLNGMESLAPPMDLERKLMASYLFQEDERAACLATVRGDVVVTTSYW
jgi:ferredoxin